jgi:Na+/phosphate symporter
MTGGESFDEQRERLGAELDKAVAALDAAKSALGRRVLDATGADDPKVRAAQAAVLSAEVEIEALESALVELDLREEEAQAAAAAAERAADIERAKELIEKRATIAAKAIAEAEKLGKLREQVRELDDELGQVERRLHVHSAAPVNGLWLTALRPVLVDRALGEGTWRASELAQLRERATNAALTLAALDDRLKVAG